MKWEEKSEVFLKCSIWKHSSIDIKKEMKKAENHLSTKKWIQRC